MSLEETILENLISNEEYSRKVLPFLKKEYFETEEGKCLYDHVQQFIIKYNSLPPKSALILDLKQELNMKQSLLDDILKKLNSFSDTSDPSKLAWLFDKTEKWCQERALFNAIYDSIQIIDGKKKQPKTSIPQILSDALAVSFDSDLGHNYLEQADERFDFFNSDIPKIPCDLDYFNRVMHGGVARKTLNLIGAGVNVGKTLHLCHLACAYALAGYKVVYFSLEMAQEEIAKRLDANLLDLDINTIKGMQKTDWDTKINRIKKRAKGNIIVKEYPTRAASVIQFKAFLRELKIKKNFIPDVIMIDYIGICASSTLKLGGTINTNTYQGSIGAEIRALAKEYNVAIWSAQQLNRDGFTSSDPDLNNTADSWDLAGIADFYIMVTQSEELAKLNQYQVIQVKSRYGDKNRHKRFVIGVDKERMRLYDVSPSAQTLTKGGNSRTGGNEDNNIRTGRNSAEKNTDASEFGEGQQQHVFRGRQRKEKFSGFKV